jgi:hypothetical protein
MKSNTKLSTGSFICIHIEELCGYIAMWGVRQSPYTVPENLDIVLAKVKEEAKGFSKIKELVYIPKVGLGVWLYRLLMPIPEFIDWNTAKKQKTNYITREYDPDCDFIDLDALIRNVKFSIIEAEEKLQSSFNEHMRGLLNG